MESYAGPVEATGLSVTYPHGVSSRYYLERDGMSLVPSSSDQMGPGGGWNFGSPPVRYTTKQVGIIPDVTIEELGHFLVSASIGLVVGNPVVSLGVGLIHWNYHILNPLVSDVYAELTGSTGGGGPGEIPNLHRPPPSIEEAGEIISNLPIRGEVPSSPRSSSSSKTGKRRKRCPPGFRWSSRLQDCIFSDKPKGYSKVWTSNRYGWL